MQISYEINHSWKHILQSIVQGYVSSLYIMAEKDNPMRKIKISKITVNIGTGESGQKLEKAKKLLEALTKRKVVTTITHDRTTFGMAKGRPIGVKVTLRGDQASSFLKAAFYAAKNKISAKSFDTTGNFSLGIQEYINMPNIKYDPEIGILGMDVTVTLERPGYRIKKKMIRSKAVGKSHQIKKEDAMEFVKKEFGVKIE